MRESCEDQYLEPYGAFADYVMDLDARYNEETGVLTVLLPVTHRTTPEPQSLMRRMSWLPSALVYIPRISITRSLRQTKKATPPTTAAFLMSMMCWFRYSLMIKRERYPSILSMTP